MARICIPIICILLTFCSISTSIDINCKFAVSGEYAIIGNVYLCININSNIFTKESAQITATTGTHENLKSNDDVNGFHANRQAIYYFPQGLDKFFKNLKSIAIWRSKLKAVHQSDLKAFPELISLNLYENSLEILEEGLLDFNPNLEVVGFHGNKIIHIDPNIFDNLSKLSNLWLDGVPCIDKNTGTVKDTQDSIKLLKSQCLDCEFLSLDEKLKSLKNESKNLSTEDFNAKFDSLEKIVSSYKFSKFRPLSYTFQELKNFTIGNPASRNIKQEVNSDPQDISKISNGTKINEVCTKCCKTDETSILDMKVGNVSKIIHELITDKILETIDTKMKLTEGRVLEKFEVLDKKLDSILEVFKSGEPKI